MTALALYDIIGSKADQHDVSRNRVRRDSFSKGSSEARFWCPVGKRWIGLGLVNSGLSAYGLCRSR